MAYTLPNSEFRIKVFQSKHQTTVLEKAGEIYFYADVPFNNNIEKILFRIEAVDSALASVEMAQRSTLIAFLGTSGIEIDLRKLVIKEGYLKLDGNSWLQNCDVVVRVAFYSEDLRLQQLSQLDVPVHDIALVLEDSETLFTRLRSMDAGNQQEHRESDPVQNQGIVIDRVAHQQIVEDEPNIIGSNNFQKFRASENYRKIYDVKREDPLNPEDIEHYLKPKLKKTKVIKKNKIQKRCSGMKAQKAQIEDMIGSEEIEKIQRAPSERDSSWRGSGNELQDLVNTLSIKTQASDGLEIESYLANQFQQSLRQKHPKQVPLKKSQETDSEQFDDELEEEKVPQNRVMTQQLYPVPKIEPGVDPILLEALSEHQTFASDLQKNRRIDNPVYATFQDFERCIVQSLNDMAHRRGIIQSLIMHNGYKNDYITVSCIFCRKFKLQFSMEKYRNVNEKGEDVITVTKICFNRCLHGNKHELHVPHYKSIGDF